MSKNDGRDPDLTPLIEAVLAHAETLDVPPPAAAFVLAMAARSLCADRATWMQLVSDVAEACDESN